MPWHGECPHGFKVRMTTDEQGWVTEWSLPECNMCDPSSALTRYKQMTDKIPSPFIVVLSGGQDSTTCLAKAIHDNPDLVPGDALAVFFNYGQKHLMAEERCAEDVGHAFKVPVYEISALGLGGIKGSALVGDGDVSSVNPVNNLPASYTPGRNMLFLTLAAALAYKKFVSDRPQAERPQHLNIVTGVCQTDYSGYPDCRREFIDRAEKALSAALDYPVNIFTPLMYKTKAETVRMMAAFGHLDVLRHTHTCYNGERPGCGTCPACVLRAKGFAEAGIADPLFGQQSA